jgi:hypothetical protein
MKRGANIRRCKARFGSLADICAAKRHVRFTPQKRTLGDVTGMPTKGQKRTRLLAR